MKRSIYCLLMLVALASVPSDVWAAGGGTAMPWESPFETVLQSVTGPVARAIGGIVIVMAGFSLTLGEASGGTKKLLWVGLGLSVTFSAVSFFLGFLGFSSGLSL